MSTYAPKIYEYDLLDNVDFSSEVEGVLRVCATYAWSVSWVVLGALETDKFKVALEYSNDGVNWDFYTCCTVIDNCLKGGFFDSSLPFLWLRFRAEPLEVENGATISAKLVLKFNR